MPNWLKAGLVLGLAAGLVLAEDPDPGYAEELQAHRESRETSLRGEYGWLSLVGLFWLEQGENRFGTDPDNAVAFPAGSSPSVAGTLDYDGKTVRLRAEASSGVTLDGQPVTDRVLRDDSQEETDKLRLGRLEFYVLARNGRHGVRVKDPQNPTRTAFSGLEFYPADPETRVHATLKPFDTPRSITVPTVAGTTSTMLAPGLLEFSLNGEDHSLMPLVSEITDRDLFIIFKDPTNGQGTYGAGRYLTAGLDENGAILDFNRAYNPPCAFTPFATCPLAPRGNRLTAKVEAGERYSGH